VNCKQRRGPDGYAELEPFCQEQGADEVPVLMAYRRGIRSEQKGEAIPLLLTEEDNPEIGTSMMALRAMEAVLRLSAPVAKTVAADGDLGETSEEHFESENEETRSQADEL